MLFLSGTGGLYRWTKPRPPDILYGSGASDPRTEEGSHDDDEAHDRICTGGVPLLGHVLQLFRRPLEMFQSLRAHGDVVVIRLGRAPAYVVNHPELIRQMLVADAKKFDKGVQFEKARPYVGNGLAISGEPLHLRQRRRMQPAFHQAQIARYAEIMRESAAATVLSWRHGQAVLMNQELFSFSLKALTRALFSTDLDARAVSEFTDVMQAFLDGLTVRVALPFDLLEKLPTRNNRHELLPPNWINSAPPSARPTLPLTRGDPFAAERDPIRRPP